MALFALATKTATVSVIALMAAITLATDLSALAVAQLALQLLVRAVQFEISLLVVIK